MTGRNPLAARIVILLRMLRGDSVRDPVNRNSMTFPSWATAQAASKVGNACSGDPSDLITTIVDWAVTSPAGLLGSRGGTEATVLESGFPELGLSADLGLSAAESPSDGLAGIVASATGPDFVPEGLGTRSGSNSRGPYVRPWEPSATSGMGPNGTVSP